MKITFKIKGFTLVEMILYVSVCAVFLLALSSLFSFLVGSRVRSQAITEVNQQGFLVMNSITRTIRNGRSIENPVMAATSSLLSITTSNPILNPTVFSIASGTMRITEGSKGAVPLTNSRVVLSNLVFQNISSASSTEKIVRISFIIDSVNQSGRSEYAFSKTFSGSATLR